MKKRIKRSYLLPLVLALATQAIHAKERAPYCLQLSSFEKYQKSDIAPMKMILESYKDARIEKIDGIYTLRVGYFKGYSEALKLQKELKDHYPDIYVRECLKNLEVRVDHKELFGFENRESKNEALENDRDDKSIDETKAKNLPILIDKKENKNSEKIIVDKPHKTLEEPKVVSNIETKIKKESNLFIFSNFSIANSILKDFSGKNRDNTLYYGLRFGYYDKSYRAYLSLSPIAYKNTTVDMYGANIDYIHNIKENIDLFIGAGVKYIYLDSSLSGSKGGLGAEGRVGANYHFDNGLFIEAYYSHIYTNKIKVEKNQIEDKISGVKLDSVNSINTGVGYRW